MLVSTSIVESGLDIPNANTMIVNRADAFGLAELYQLRGRIGRSRHRAFAYLLIPGEDALTDTARRRIEVLREYSHLGAGFQVALFDLEIRGAGNIVGYEQSGQIAALGFEMYAQLLRDTIRELQGEPVPEERPTQVTICLPTVLPETYVAETPQRLGFYKRIAAARDPAALEEAGRRTARAVRAPARAGAQPAARGAAAPGRGGARARAHRLAAPTRSRSPRGAARRWPPSASWPWSPARAGGRGSPARTASPGAGAAATRTGGSPRRSNS